MLIEGVRRARDCISNEVAASTFHVSVLSHIPDG
jgi:hypothetical protein